MTDQSRSHITRRGPLSFVITLLGIWTINFFLVALAPGDATNLYFGHETDRSSIEQLREQRGLDRPLATQFVFWTGRFLKGDLGYSWTRHQPVAEILLEALPATLQLTFLALLFSLVVGTLWGLLAGIYVNRFSGHVLHATGIVLYSVPTFWIASILVLVFAMKLEWFPALGANPLDIGGGGLLVDRLKHLVLPVTALGLIGVAATARFTRSRFIQTMEQDYVRLAVAKGLPRPRVFLRHAFSNALLPVITLVGLHLPFLIGGAFVVEVIFAWPGMGRIMYEAFLSRDCPIILATNLLIAVVTVSGSFLADLLSRVADPRIRYHEGKN